jgi:uncharacterized DUF497 family protein
MLRFEWDEKKAERNLLKHGISFETAILVFEDPCVVSEMDRVIDGEERWQSIGAVGDVLVLLVAHTRRDDGDSGEVIQ